MCRLIAFLFWFLVAFQATAVTRYHGDNLNSSSALSSSTAPASQQEVNVYYPFGRIQTASPQASFQVSRRFTGQVFDAESGLYYYNARYYDPELGRFIQPDDIIPDLSNPQSYNRYSYVLNDPLRYNDPLGHEVGYTYDAQGMHSPFDSPESAARMEWANNHVVIPAVNAAFWTMDKADAGINRMRTSANPFIRGAGAGLWGASWIWGGGETKVLRETRNLAKVVDEARVITKSLATAKNEAVFWSSFRDSGAAAAKWAAQNGGSTLETTLATRGIKLPVYNVNNPASVAAWQQASKEFAAGASGDVRVLQGNLVDVKSTWAQVEFPALKANSKVTSITAVNPDTGTKTLLWKR